jgi:hypothetical protein
MCRSAFVAPVGAFEQVTIRAARRVRKVSFAIDVTREAGGARGIRSIPMAAMATRAVLMLRFRMQAGQRRESVAARARGCARDATWPVRAMAGRATRGERAVRRRGFNRVASGALSSGARARVRLMAVRADLVADGRRGELPNVTSFAFGRDAARVRLMATSAHLVSRPHFATSIRVARDARRANAAWLVRQTQVATGARGVTHARRSQGQFLLVAIGARDVLRLRQLEVVRHVTALTGDARVKVVLGRGNLMTTAAILGDRVFFRARRVRFMTGDAGPASNALGMIRMHVRVALRTRRSGVVTHVVRGVAIRAQRVSGHESRREHHHIGVARTAVQRTLRLELVRAVAANALRVTSGEQCRYRHDGLSLAVTFGTRGERIQGGGVLMSVTGRAHAVWGFAGRGVRGVDVHVAACAIGGHRLLILMRAVAVQARGGGVHGHGRDLALGLVVAARAISRTVRFERASVGGVGVAVGAREGVAIHAIRMHAGTEALLRQAARVLDRGASGMARRTANRRNGAHRSGVQLMTLIARDVLLDHVHAVPSHAAIRPPVQLDVHAFARRPCSALVRTLRGTTDDSGEHEQADEQNDGEPHEATQGPRIIRISNPTCDCGI